MQRTRGGLMAGTSADEVRQAVVRAALPLIGDYDSLTTAQLARAAGIGEADLLAVFPGMEAVLQACAATMVAHMTAVMDPAAEVGKLDAIRTDQPLASRLVEVLGIVDAYHRRVRAGLDAYHRRVRAGLDAYHRRVRAGLDAFEQSVVPAPAGAPSSGRSELPAITSQPEVRRAVARLLAPDGQRLRLPTAALAEAFLTMSGVAARTANEERSPLPAEQVVDLFLHGALITS
jgi:AcrR family transcriptional regulator